MSQGVVFLNSPNKQYNSYCASEVRNPHAEFYICCAAFYSLQNGKKIFEKKVSA